MIHSFVCNNGCFQNYFDILMVIFWWYIGGFLRGIWNRLCKEIADMEDEEATRRRRRLLRRLRRRQQAAVDKNKKPYFGQLEDFSVAKIAYDEEVKKRGECRVMSWMPLDDPKDVLVKHACPPKTTESQVLSFAPTYTRIQWNSVRKTESSWEYRMGPNKLGSVLALINKLKTGGEASLTQDDFKMKPESINCARKPFTPAAPWGVETMYVYVRP